MRLMWFLQGGGLAALMLLGLALCGGLPSAGLSHHGGDGDPDHAFHFMPAALPTRRYSSSAAAWKPNSLPTAPLYSPMARFAANNPYLHRTTEWQMSATAESVPTGLVWPSEKAEGKLREEDGIK